MYDLVNHSPNDGNLSHFLFFTSIKWAINAWLYMLQMFSASLLLVLLLYISYYLAYRILKL